MAQLKDSLQRPPELYAQEWTDKIKANKKTATRGCQEILNDERISPLARYIFVCASGLEAGAIAKSLPTVALECLLLELEQIHDDPEKDCGGRKWIVDAVNVDLKIVA